VEKTTSTPQERALDTSAPAHPDPNSIGGAISSRTSQMVETAALAHVQAEMTEGVPLAV
jgi:hypothetical protein